MEAIKKIFSRIKDRSPDSHKGNFGHVFVLAGSVFYTGAPYLVSRGALLSGSGLVTLGIGKSLYSVMATRLIEVMVTPFYETKDMSLSVLAERDIVRFSENDLKILHEKRERSKFLLEMFVKEGLNPFTYGSIARGDVHKDSDIDIVIEQSISPFQIELILNKNGFNHYFREIIMATPTDTVKLYIYLSELESITIPLSKFDKRTKEFFNFGGKINLDQLQKNIRVPGIDKRLLLIHPITDGYEEYSVIGNEHIAAKQLNVSIDLINERKRVLLKREKYGKTGVFLKRPIDIYESTENVVKKLIKKNSIVRKKLISR